MAEREDDLLNADEIEALLSAADANETPPPGRSSGHSKHGMPAPPESPGEAPDQAKAGGSRRSAEELLERAEAELAAAISPDFDRQRPIPPELGDASPFQFQAFDSDYRPADPAVPLDALQDVELDLRIELGRTQMLIDEVLKLTEGSVVPLDKLAGDPVDILVNGRLIARGEVLVLNDNFCVRVAEILPPDF